MKRLVYDRGYFGIVIYKGKNALNYGTLFRTANILGAAFLGIIGPRFKRQHSDTLKSDRHIPLYEYQTFEEFYQRMPYDCRLIGVELDDKAKLVETYDHPERAIYLLGAEDNGLPPNIVEKCHDLVKLQGNVSMNVAVAGSIVVYDRLVKTKRKEAA